MAEEEQNETAAEERLDETAEAEATEQAEQPAAEAEAPEQAEQPATEAEAPAEPEEQLHPKEARRRARSRHTGEARAERSPEERQDERLAARQRKAAARRSRRGKLKTARAGQAKAVEPTAPAHEHGPGRPKVRQGVVVSDKADKTITVRIDTARRHRRYEKIVRSSSTLHAHDEANEANAGDLVRVIESRPLSRTKRWRLVEILERAR